MRLDRRQIALPEAPLCPRPKCLGVEACGAWRRRAAGRLKRLVQQPVDRPIAIVSAIHGVLFFNSLERPGPDSLRWLPTVSRSPRSIDPESSITHSKHKAISASLIFA